MRPVSDSLYWISTDLVFRWIVRPLCTGLVRARRGARTELDLRASRVKRWMTVLASWLVGWLVVRWSDNQPTNRVPWWYTVGQTRKDSNSDRNDWQYQWVWIVGDPTKPNGQALVALRWICRAIIADLWIKLIDHNTNFVFSAFHKTHIVEKCAVEETCGMAYREAMNEWMSENEFCTFAGIDKRWMSWSRRRRRRRSRMTRRALHLVWPS